MTTAKELFLNKSYSDKFLEDNEFFINPKLFYSKISFNLPLPKVCYLCGLSGLNVTWGLTSFRESPFFKIIGIRSFCSFELKVPLSFFGIGIDLDGKLF